MRILKKSAVIPVILAILFSFLGFTAECEDIPRHILRLHVIANSDSAEDQALKLKVRDRILLESGGLLDDVSGKSEAEAIANAQLPAFRDAAARTIRKQGFSYPVKAELVTMYFPTRRYGSVTIPAGKYDAVRVTIGKGEGKNWWCVMFPPLCLPAAEKNPELKDVLDTKQMAIVTGNYQIRFKSVEIYEELKCWMENLERR